MSLSSAAVVALAIQCAPNVAPQTVAAIVRTESAGKVLAINVNGARQPAQAKDLAEAVAIARRYIALGYSVDMGLGQINSRNMATLGLDWDTAFEPCANIRALGTLLTRNFKSARPGRADQNALRAALSMYNTGSMSRGFRNGYVDKVIRNAAANGHVKPIAGTHSRSEITVHVAATKVLPDRSSNPPPRWNVFQRARWERQTEVGSEEGAANP